MKIKKNLFGTTVQGEEVYAYTLTGEGIAARILTYGATVQALWVPDKNGKPVDVVLGYDSIGQYEENDGYLGACIGRVGNRIGKGSFTLNGETYCLACNDGENHLHGGLRGFDKCIWDATELTDGVRMTRLSPDGEEGYPGNLQVSVSYRLIGHALQIAYEASSDRDTLCSLTNHTYFNLTGGGTVRDHLLQVDADRFLENDEGCLPTGVRLRMEGTPFDFRQEKPIGADMDKPHIQLSRCGGYDHNFCLNPGDGHAPSVRLTSPASGITMTVTTTMPGVQVYTGNFLTDREGKNGVRYGKQGAVCLETQFYPNAMACAEFEKPILRRGERYYHVSTYGFGGEK